MFTDLRRSATQTGQLLNPFTSLPDGPHGLLLQRRSDGRLVGSQITDRAGDPPTSQPIQAALADGSDVALDSGSAKSGDLGRLLTGEPAVQQPQDEHLAADVFVRVRVALGVDERLLFLGQVSGLSCRSSPQTWQRPGQRPGRVRNDQRWSVLVGPRSAPSWRVRLDTSSAVAF